MPNCFSTPIPKFHVFMLPLSLVVVPSEKLDYYPKMRGKTNFMFKFFKFSPETKYVLQLVKKQKLKRYFNYCKFVLLFFRSKTVLPKFEKKYLTNFNFEFYFLGLFFVIQGRILHIKKLIFKVSAIF